MMTNDFISFGKWILNEFKIYRDKDTNGSKLVYVWEEGLIRLQNGYSVSRLLKEASLEELSSALQNFKSMEDSNLIKGKNSPY